MGRGWTPPPLTDEQAARLIDDLTFISQYHYSNELTAHEVAMLAWIASGYSYRETAVRMAISQETVHSALHHIRDKLGARNTVHAAALAMDHGLIELHHNELV